MNIKLGLKIAGQIGKFLIKRHTERAVAKATLRQAWREYQADRYNAELRERVAGKVPYDASIHEETLRHQGGINLTTRIDLMRGKKGEQGK